MDEVEYKIFDLSDESQCDDVRRDYSFDVVPSPEGNRVMIHPSSTLRGGSMRFGGRGNTIIFGENCRFRGELICVGSGAKATIGGGPHEVLFQLTLYDEAEFHLGSDPTIYGMRAWVAERTRLEIGRDALISEGVTIRTTDHHTIFDLDLLTQLNWPGDVCIGDHVWIGQDVSVTKQVTVGRGSVVGAKSLVSRDIPDCEMWAGVPARMIRQGVSWVREHPAKESQLLACREDLRSHKP